MARWVDYDGAYKTMNTPFMESVMWAFKTCYDKGLIYRDYRVTPYCTHCETSLSISDTRESDSTRPRQDRWVAVKFKTPLVESGKPVCLLAWTTTPWTLPSNLCLAVGEGLRYAFVDVGDEIYVACKDTLKNFVKVFGETPAIVRECEGRDLLGTTPRMCAGPFLDVSLANHTSSASISVFTHIFQRSSRYFASDADRRLNRTKCGALHVRTHSWNITSPCDSFFNTFSTMYPRRCIAEALQTANEFSEACRKSHDSRSSLNTVAATDSPPILCSY